MLVRWNGDLPSSERFDLVSNDIDSSIPEVARPESARISGARALHQKR